VAGIGESHRQDVEKGGVVVDEKDATHRQVLSGGRRNR
jgi:hypothetical protein